MVLRRERAARLALSHHQHSMPNPIQPTMQLRRHEYRMHGKSTIRADSHHLLSTHIMELRSQECLYDNRRVCRHVFPTKPRRVKEEPEFLIRMNQASTEQTRST